MLLALSSGRSSSELASPLMPAPPIFRWQREWSITARWSGGCSPPWCRVVDPWTGSLWRS